MRVLSVDAWREAEGSWGWNNWHHVANVTKAEFEACGDSARKLLKLFRDRTGLAGWGQVAIEDDGYNVVVVERHTREPLYAIEYGPEY